MSDSENKLAALVCHGMLLNTGTFIDFCKLVNGFPEEQVVATFDSLNSKELEQVLNNVINVTNEVIKTEAFLQEALKQLKEKEKLETDMDRMEDHGS